VLQRDVANLQRIYDSWVAPLLSRNNCRVKI
ncbi:MAG: hypothetical protein ACI9YH_003071, partial [Colwellia sp.]